MPTIRLVHLSDVHVTARPLGWRREDWLNKRLAAWMNLRLLGRGLRFRHADRVLAALIAEVRRGRPDRVVFSGDATALGFEAELVRAAELLGVSGDEPLPGLAVPGNHDYCTVPAERSGLFERHFAPWLAGERVGGATYPFAQQVGPVWLVAVNSSCGNRWAWDASGWVGPEQLGRLRELLRRLRGGPRVLITHYPVVRSNGRRERGARSLRDLDDLLKVADEGGIGLWLHGHRHGAYQVSDPKVAPFPIVCAGSATQSGRWSYGQYAIEGSHFAGARRVYDPQTGGFRNAETFEMVLRG